MLVVDPLEVRSTVRTALFEHRVDQLVLAGVVYVQEFDHVFTEGTDHLHALRVEAGVGDVPRGRVQRVGERLVDGVHVRHVGGVVAGTCHAHRMPELALPSEADPQVSHGYDAGSLARVGE